MRSSRGSLLLESLIQVKTALPLGSEGRIDAELPRSLKKVPIYGKLGDKLTLLIVLVGLLVLWRPKLNKLVK